MCPMTAPRSVSSASSSCGAGGADALGPHRDLLDGFLAGDVEDGPPGAPGHRVGHREQQRALARPGRPAAQAHLAGHQTAAEDAVELADAGGQPLDRAAGDDLGHRPGRPGRAWLARALERRPGVAVGAASSTTVENSPHLGQRPYHLPGGGAAGRQRNTLVARATVRRRCGRSSRAPGDGSAGRPTAQPNSPVADGPGTTGLVRRRFGQRDRHLHGDLLPASANVNVTGIVVPG